MTLKVKWEKGVFKPLEKVSLKEEGIYEIEIKPAEKEVRSVKAGSLKGLVGLISIGGNALEDSERIYDK